MAVRGDIEVDDKHVLYTIARYDAMVSPLGLQVFLETRVDPYLRARAEARFANEGDDVTGPWAPLKGSTEDIRASLGFPRSHPINVRTGDLKEYVTRSPSETVPFGSGAILTMPGAPSGNGEVDLAFRTAQVGSSNPYTHPRPVLGLGGKDATEIMMLLMFFIGEGVMKTGAFVDV